MPENTLPTRRSAAVLTACAALIAVVAVVTAGLLSRRSQARDLQVRAAAQAVPAVKLVEPTALAAETLELPARLEPWARAPIHARVSGYLKRWSIDIGGSVKAGQVLGEIETPELDEQLAQARAELATARSNAALAASTARRWQSLLATDSVSRQEADEKAGDLAAKQSVVHALQANVDRVQATKQYARLLAPFDGVVTARNTDVGALIGAGGSPGNELFVVSDIRRLRVYVNVPQRQATAVRMGSEAQLIVPERPAQVYRARVESLAHAIQSGSGAMLVQLVVDNQAGELLPGGFATVRFPFPSRSAGSVCRRAR
ncbi:efflux RND transporter periplasmic adaptor subunit [Ralstonia syzygii subsp. celebesensis]